MCSYNIYVLQLMKLKLHIVCTKLRTHAVNCRKYICTNNGLYYSFVPLMLFLEIAQYMLDLLANGAGGVGINSLSYFNAL